MPRWGERERRAIVVALASLLFVGLGLGLHGATVRGVGISGAEALADVTDELAPLLADEVAVEVSVSDLVALSGASPIEIPRVDDSLVVELAAPRSTAPRKGPAPKQEPVLGISIRASAVRAAIARGGRPSGSAVSAAGTRPAGLILSGVSGYGTALRDGDLLTRVGGTAATSEGRVVAAVSGAIRSGAKAIDGEIWRGGRRIPFVVEIPRGKKKKPRP
jgi:hypothetical protein